MRSTKAHLTERGKERIVELKASMNKARKDFTLPTNHRVVITFPWLLGLIEGDGCFNKLVPRLSIQLIYRQEFVLKAILEFFGGLGNLSTGKPRQRVDTISSQPMVILEFNKIAFLRNVIIPGFKALTFLSKKGKDFEDWSICVEIYFSGRHTLAEGEFFGFLEATVEAPSPDTPGGYIGLLPLKVKGRLVCPGGIFKGFFFSEELRFALENGYTLLNITKAYSFQKGINTFKDLINQLNSMKIQAQQDNKPTIRNIAKLLMNSMYGRFGMHTDNVRQAFLNTQQIVDLAKHYVILNEIPLGALSLVSYTLSRGALVFGNSLDSKIQKFLEGLPGNTNVAIAAAVTSYSRMIINKYKLLALEQNLEIYYSDTDSLVLNFLQKCAIQLLWGNSN